VPGWSGLRAAGQLWEQTDWWGYGVCREINYWDVGGTDARLVINKWASKLEIRFREWLGVNVIRRSVYL